MSIEVKSGTFTIYAKPSISVLFPSVTIVPVIVAKSIQTISWETKGNISYVRVEYLSRLSSALVNETAHPLVSSTSSKNYSWTVPTVFNAEIWGRIRITDVDNPLNVSYGSSFTINSGAFSLFYPNGGETIITGKYSGGDWIGATFSIQWIPLLDPAGILTDIYLSLDNGVTWNIIVSGIPASSGRYDWVIPWAYDPTSSAMIKIQEHGFSVTSQSGAFTFYTSSLQHHNYSSVNDAWNAVSIPPFKKGSVPFNITWTEDFINGMSTEAQANFANGLATFESQVTAGGEAATAAIASLGLNLTDPKNIKNWQNVVAPDVGLPQSAINKLDSFVSKLDSLTKLLLAAAKLAKVLLASENIMYQILLALVEYVHKLIIDMINSWLAAGIYFTYIPRDFDVSTFGKSMYNKYAAVTGLYEQMPVDKTLDGGFPGFLSRLEYMLFDPTDKTRPQLDYAQSITGGAIFVIDTGNMVGSTSAIISKLFKTLQLIAKFLGIDGNFQTLPPINVRTSYGMYPTGKKYGTADELLFGVKVEWDAAPGLYNCYRISRSKRSGGVFSGDYYDYSKRQPAEPIMKYEDDHDKTGKDTFPLSERFGSIPGITSEAVLSQLTSTGTPIVVKKDNLTGGGSYIDFNVIANDSDTYGSNPQTYYYVVQSTFLEFDEAQAKQSSEFYIDINSKYLTFRTMPLWSQFSNEASATPLSCIPVSTMLAYVQHNDGVELLSSNFPYGKHFGQGQWAFFRPIDEDAFYVQKGLKQLDEAFAKIKTWLGTNQQAITGWFNMMLEKIQNVLDILQLIKGIIEILKLFKLDPSMKFLWIPPALGGTRGFMDRVKAAGNAPTSGPADYTFGGVMLFGSGSIEALTATIKAMGILLKMFGIKT